MSEDPGAPEAVPNARVPRLGAPAFACPHCKAYAQQRWFTVAADKAGDPPSESDLVSVDKTLASFRAQKAKGEEPPYPIEKLQSYRDAIAAGDPLLEQRSSGIYVYWNVNNAYFSECFVCDRATLWIGGRVRYPTTSGEVAEPNEDLPGDIRRDYSEAAEVVLASPRAAAALLRLAIQKLCSHLLERDGNINEMIGDLVKRGLSPLVQRALDVVRVIGNEAVHPGELDLRDDQGTAMQLFGLVNLIADAMITQPTNVLALYRTLPPDKVAGIEQRDAKARLAADREG